MATEPTTKPPRTAANLASDSNVVKDRRAASSGDGSAPDPEGCGPLLDGGASFDRYDPGSDLVRKVAADAWRAAGHGEDDPGDVVTLTISELDRLGDALIADMQTAERGEGKPDRLAAALRQVEASRSRRYTE